jgi:guanylate kinase
MQKNTVFILSGPAGAGKTTLWHAIENEASHIEKVITTTSRTIREGETDGTHYHFLTKPEFEAQIHTGNLIEYAIVHTNYYGSTYSELERIIANDKSPIYIIEPQGMVHLKPLLEDKGYDVVTIFLLPPSLDELKKRLHNRGTETPEQFEIRLATALTELEQQDFYDIKITNDNLELAKKELQSILTQGVL